MQTKGDRTKQAIVDISKKLFAKKGYSAITMKDICEACELSRGGLYRHFNSTKEIFIAMLEKDKNETRDALEQSLLKKLSAERLLNHYLNFEKETVMSEESGLYFAIHEFAFVERDECEYLEQRKKSAVDMLIALFQYGQSRSEFKSFNPEVMAVHYIYFWDSLKTSAFALLMTEEMIDKQIQLLKEMIM